MEGVLEGREGRPRRGDRAVGPEEEEVGDKVEEEQGGGRRRDRRRTPLCLQLERGEIETLKIEGERERKRSEIDEKDGEET